MSPCLNILSTPLTTSTSNSIFDFTDKDSMMGASTLNRYPKGACGDMDTMTCMTTKPELFVCIT